MIMTCTFSFEGIVEMIGNCIHLAHLDRVADIRILGFSVICDRNIHFPEIEIRQAGAPKMAWVLIDDKLPEGRHRFPASDFNFEGLAEQLAEN